MSAINDFALESALMASRANYVVHAFDLRGNSIAEYGPIPGVHAMRQLADQLIDTYPDCELIMRRLPSAAQDQQGGEQ